MHSRDERLAVNETLFRAANERITENADQWGVAQPGTEIEFFCECSSRDCRLRIRLTVAEYERIRRDPHQFFVRRGHELLEIERVVESSADYLVVRKVGVAGDVAVETDPRS